MDDRAKEIFAAARAVLPELPGMIGSDAPAVEAELRAALKHADVAWQADVIREILRRHPATRRYLLDRVPATSTPRYFGGGGRLRD